jgi:hypothetical protein
MVRAAAHRQVEQKNRGSGNAQQDGHELLVYTILTIGSIIVTSLLKASNAKNPHFGWQ